MIWYPLQIGRWTAEFYFAPDGYDAGEVLDRMYEFGAPADILRRADELMTSGDLNTGFTFSNPAERLAVVAIGPTSGGGVQGHACPRNPPPCRGYRGEPRDRP